MKQLIVAGSLLLAALFSSCGDSTQERRNADDEAQIRSEIDGYLNAWNAGDADALAAYYEVDGDRANNSGDVFRGRAAIRDHYRKVFSQSPPAGVERRLIYHDVGVRLLSLDAAVVDVDYEVSGVRAEVGFPVRGRNTVVLIKRDGRWMRAAHRNSLAISPDCLKLCAAKGYLPAR
jgi:uncharacterized protein (TIGR02246 family)